MSRSRRITVAALAAVTIAGGVAWAGQDEPPITPDPGPSVRTTGVLARAATLDKVERVTAVQPVLWPAPGLTPLVRSEPAGTDVQVLDRAASAAAGVSGPALRVHGDGGRVTVDYARYRNAYGGDWASRLRLVRLGAKGPVPVASRNDAKAGTVTGQLAGGETYALDAAPSGPAGDYKATSLSPSGSWQVSRQTGDFTWSEPVGTPVSVPGEFAPEFAVSYASGSVDGRVASTNNQASWVGEGHDLGAGFIERRYKGCADDLATGQPKTGDLCWETDNATLSLGGGSSDLVRIGNSNRWRPADDDGSRIERLTGAPNGARDGEHWRVTTPDGTQHHFGLHRLPGWDAGEPDSASTWTVPVFGNETGEPCHGATFATSHCVQAWRWNLDYSVDADGNSISYFYAPEGNFYGLNNGATKAAYTRGGVLLRAEYGARHGDDPTARIVFDSAERCTTGTTCARTAMPDVPWDQACETATCPTKVSPTFWSTKRLARVASEVPRDSGWAPVDEWTFTHSFPATGDGTTPALWLDGISHSGVTAEGVRESTPPVRFLPAPYNNRVDTSSDGLPPMPKFRISTVRMQAGGEVNVVYDRDCDPAALPAPHANSTRCFPVRWTPDGASARNDWFAKYTVARVTGDDRVGGSALMVTNYEYLGGAGWRYNDDPLAPPDHRTWSRYRGYEKVRVTRGDHTNPAAVRSAATYLYHRGMHGDHQPGGGTRTAVVRDSRGVEVEDADQLAGFLREEIVHDGVGGAEVAGSIHDAHQRETAVSGPLRAHQIDVAATRTRTTIPGGRRTTRVEYTYNDDGLLTTVSDLGEEGDPDDDLCTRKEYARDATAWRLDLVSREQVVGVACSVTPVFPRDAISEQRTYYDGEPLGVPPTDGESVRTEVLDAFDGATPEFATTARTTFDDYGRETASEDALERRSSTSFTPQTGRPTSSTTIDPKGFKTTTTFESLRGQPVTILDVDNTRKTELAYDALGRLTGVWLPGRRKGVFGPNTRYRYLLRENGASWVATEQLNANGSTTTSYELYDGFLRERQTQGPGSGGGRVFTATHYDSRGLVVKETGPEHTGGEPSGDLISVPDGQAYRQTVTTYDGAGRPTVEALHSLAEEKWRSATEHHGDGTSVTPPAGGTAERVFTDARGRVVRRRQYRAATPTGEHETTEYGFDNAGRLVSVTDAIGNRWRYDYDLRGRRVRTVDPDSGTSTSTYDDAGQLETATDGRGKTLAYAYDVLGRKTAVRADGPAGTELANWTYDTLSGGKGLPTRSTRLIGSARYTVEVTGYEAATGRPQGSKVVIPAAETGVNGTYTSEFTYRPDGSPDTTAMPALGTLAAETLTHTYDALGQPLGLSSPRGQYVSRTEYSWFGQRTQLTLGPESREAWHTLFYDEATHRLRRAFTQRRGDPSTVNDTTYGYDPAGNVTRISDQFMGAAAEDQCFRHDHARRLTEAWTSTAGCDGAPGSSLGGPAPYWTSWRYDPAGNRTSEIQHAAGGDTTRTYRYPEPGQPRPHAVQSVTTSGPAGTRTDAFECDAGGNTTVARGQALDWDHEGHLASMGSSRFVYDADGNRLIRRDAGGKTLFLPGGEVRWTEGGTTRAGTRYYQHGGELVAARDASGLHYLVGDHHGTDEIRIDAASLAAVKRRSDPFGNPRGVRPAWPGSKGFVGGVIDPTGLTHLGAREYDPEIGRFISVDPLIDVDDPQQINGYAYANNSPVTLSDPDGLIATRCPDGECRFEGYKKNQSPAARFNNRRRAVGVRCPDGARSCWAARGAYAKPFVKKPQPKPAPPRGWKDRLRDGVRGFADTPGIKQFLQYSKPMVGQAVDRSTEGYDPTSGSYQIGGVLGEAALSAIPAVGRGAAGVARAAVSVRLGWRSYRPAAGAPAAAVVKKGPIPDEIPTNLPEQMAMDSAKAGYGSVIMRDLGDAPRLVSNYGAGPWVKMQNVARGPEQNVTVHWFRNLDTGANVEFKFTQRYYGHMKPSGLERSRTGNSPQ